MTLTELNEEMLRAAHINNFTAVRHCLAQGADLHARGTKGRTAAIELAYNGNGAAVYELACTDKTVLTTADDEGYTPAIWLACAGEKCIDFLVMLAEMEPAILHQHNGMGSTPAILLAFVGRGAELLRLAKLDASILGQRDEDEATPIILLADWGDKPHESIMALVKMEPQTLLQTNRIGESAASFLARDGQLRTILEMAALDERVVTRHSPAHTNRVMWNLMISRQKLAIHLIAGRYPNVLNQLQVRDYLQKNKLSFREKLELRKLRSRM